MEYIFTGFIFGLLGSAHCIGMCGPIALALPGLDQSWTRVISNRILYNIGRTLTYAAMGAAIGIFGAGIKLAGFQQVASVLTGVVLLAVAFFPRLNPDHWLHRVLPGIPAGVQSRISRLFAAVNDHEPRHILRQSGTFLGIGLLNGLLPCGFVYLAVAASVVSGSVAGGALYMALFGLGTLPAMLAVALSPRVISLETRSTLRRFFPYVVGLVGILLILRGLSLGIPFISPVLTDGAAHHH